MAGNVPYVNIVYEGNIIGTNAGIYKVRCVCDDNCYFVDTGTNTCETEWKIGKYTLICPTPERKYPYTGESIEPKFVNYSPNILTISGEISGVELGDYVAFFDIIDKNNYEWASDVTLLPKNNGKAAVGWEIVSSVVIAKIPYQNNSLVYNRRSQSPVFANYNINLMTLIGGIPSKINTGEYQVVFRLKNNCEWSDGTAGDKTVIWKINKKKVPLPYIKTVASEGGMYYYELEGKRYPVWENYEPDIMVMSGDTYDIDNSWHTTYFDLKDPTNYEWTNSRSDTYSVKWKLTEPYVPTFVPGGGENKVHIPRQVNIPYENGTTKYPVWDQFDNTAIVKTGGAWEGINAGEYSVLLDLHDGYVWEDGTVGVKIVTWKILAVGEPMPEEPDPIVIHIPVQINIPYFDGYVKQPEWDIWAKFGIDVVKGDLYGVLAGKYYVTLRPQTGYVWDDGTTEDKVVVWIINSGDDIPDDPVPREPDPEREPDDGRDGGNSCCCCNTCCDTRIFDIFKCTPEDNSSCDCT